MTSFDRSTVYKQTQKCNFLTDRAFIVLEGTQRESDTINTKCHRKNSSYIKLNSEIYMKSCPISQLFNISTVQ